MFSSPLRNLWGRLPRWKTTTRIHHPIRANASSPQISSPNRFRKYARRAGYIAVCCGTVYVADKTLNASSLTRSIRTLWTCIVITLDYKLNFTPEQSHLIPQLHERVADRMYNLFTSNGGLYIKIGQAMGANPAVLPLPFQIKFSKLFDDAPQIPMSVVRSVFLSEFGRPPSGPDGVFEYFDDNAVASASIAQVHRAMLWEKDEHGRDQWVAVKIQKPDVGKQVEWDLTAYKFVSWMFERWVFDLPMYFVCEFVSDHLRRELDFVQEASNALETSKHIALEPYLASRVYIPSLYPQLSTKKIMTAEWIDGVRLTDRPALRRLMGIDPGHDAPLKGGFKSIMEIMITLFSAQIFSFGWVHCDPHPGNIIIRPNPSAPRTPQLVLLDHGLYVSLTEEFRRQYAVLWKSLLTLDWKAIEQVAIEWGIGTPDLFASAVLLRPVKYDGEDGGRRGSGGNGDKDESAEISEYEQSVRLKAKLKNFLTDTDKMPKELIFLGRNMRMVQGHSQSFSSPVNRIKITSLWASRSLTMSPSLTFSQRLGEYYRHVLFRTAILFLDIAFLMTRIRQWVQMRLGWESEGFEDELERTMRGFAKNNLGVEVAPEAFAG